MYNLRDFSWQFDWNGLQLVNQRLLVCDECLDDPAPAYRTLIIPPDPPPISNARPETYAIDESDWLSTQNGNRIVTQNNLPIITQIPNPADNADTAILTTSMNYHSGSVNVYLDLFNGDPTGSGAVSILKAITGSSTRINLATILTTANNVAVNTNVLVIAASSPSQVNISHAAVYSASSGGSPLASAMCGATWPTIVAGAAVQFNALGLSINFA